MAGSESRPGFGTGDDPLEPSGWEDQLSGADGPTFASRTLESELARARRYGRPLTVVLVELVGATNLSTTWGHDVAQQALASLGRCLRRSVRNTDHMARIAPFRFGLLLTE